MNGVPMRKSVLQIKPELQTGPSLPQPMQARHAKASVGEIPSPAKAQPSA